MSYICDYVDMLEHQPLVGTGQCVALVQAYAKNPDTGALAPHTAEWTQGATVMSCGPDEIAHGTAIATFVNGVYPNQDHGNHAALYLSHDGNGIMVMDQWSTKADVSSRLIRPTGEGGSNDALAFSVIE